MDITYDPGKNQRNIDERSLSFDRVKDLDFSRAIFKIDDRQDNGEIRWRGFAPMDDRVHAFVFVKLEFGIRVISFRKANRKVVRHYEKEIEAIPGSNRT